MGEFAKKWIAGIAAAVVIVTVAGIAIGKMEHKPAPTSANSGVLKTTSLSATSSAISARVPVAEPASEATAPKPSAPAEVTAAAQKSTVKTSWRRVTESRTVPPNYPASPVENAPGPAQNDAQPVMAQQVPQAPPDVATPPVQPVQQAVPATVPVSRTDGMLTTGNVSVNGAFTKDSSLIYPNDQLTTPGQNGALVTSNGNAIALGSNSQFRAESMNWFQLDAGASNVNTSTGMSARVKDYTIEPVANAPTQYEVGWQEGSVFVFARTNDITVKDKCGRSWRLQQGKLVKISSPTRCGAVVWITEPRKLPGAVVWGSAAGAGTGVLIWIATHQERPALSPP